ncbi:hypothetical protein ERO13_D06G146100v2 [Gossypium hirsutum]|uniref:Auxin-responsive protein n=8 Tax=Gossypium TaxID=3633 RepID=A0A0D2UE28_GOSRA|nr:hypothetical protein ES319_D06G172100v1 [Gossypium barbadense]KAG4142719.1 hypothetical protein ERO13_D06G146100v2 [Gossypium hirsutum]KJB67019.1 hypothetical protein B456_010G170300 [Gossypium raimondii]TYG65411.1 hypothetical protein ES288_D06G183500v1 [Gossypium darwinii]TYH67394.1 hypothetical protein ES332_D06G185500v1 [Gossypium tomentosum]TYI77888.1 hypothetical protein E1A91_D06G173100v1 [Gossypium mustelinum]
MLRHLWRKRGYYRQVRREEGEGVVPKGYVPVMVGRGEEEGAKFFIHIDMFKNDYFVSLLEMIAVEVGYENPGILRIPCHTQCFTHILNQISRINT